MLMKGGVADSACIRCDPGYPDQGGHHDQMYLGLFVRGKGGLDRKGSVLLREPIFTRENG